MAVGRAKRNLWRESWVGAIASVGDPLGRTGSWMGGADFTYATSRFRGDKNFLAGVWALAAGRKGSARTPPPRGFKIDYPNDLWDLALTYKRIGRDFDPSIGFVPRPAVHLTNIDRQLQSASPARTDPADVLRVRAVRGPRSDRTLGELSRVRRADQLALPQRRSRRVQRRAHRRAPARAVRSGGRRDHPARVIQLAALPARGGHRAKTPVLHAADLVVRRTSIPERWISTSGPARGTRDR